VGQRLGAALLRRTCTHPASRSAASTVRACQRDRERQSSLHEASFEESYATLFYATFDPATRILRYINAGHNPPLVRRATGAWNGWRREERRWACSRLDVHGGLVRLNPGDVLVAYTDGIVETQDACGAEWGAERLVRIVEESSDETAAQINARIWKTVDRLLEEPGSEMI